MPQTHEIHDEGSRVEIVLRGEVDPQSLEHLIDEIYAARERLGEKPRLWDFSEASLPLSAEATESLAEYAQRLRGASLVRVAILAPGDLEFGMARMFESLMNSGLAGEEHLYAVFRTRDAALAFLER